MNNKFNLLIIFLILICFHYGCSNSEPIKVGGEPIIYQLKNTKTFFTDTLTIFGENLGEMRDSSYLIFNDTLKISAYNCLRWQNNRIDLLVPRLPQNSSFYVVVDAQKVKYDSVNYYQNIEIFPYPPFDALLLNAGSFAMGSTDFGISDEAPIHTVQLTKSIYVATCEVTQRLYSLLMNANPADSKGDNLPIYNVSWLDAIQFCNALSAASGLEKVYTIIESKSYVTYDTAANGWRLPSEAEWEYFANLDISGEDSLKLFAWFSINSGLQPHTVGSLMPNFAGLHDVLGNVWEWCWDYYGANYYGVSSLVNPLGAKSGAERVMRGGSFEDGKLLVRAQCRKSTKIAPKVGIRVVRNQ